MAGYDYRSAMTQEEVDWPKALRSADSTEQGAAVASLREVLIRGLRVAFQGRTDVSEAHLEDFAQESLIRVMNRLAQFQGRSRFTTWAQAIAVNTAFAELRRKRWQDVSLDALLEEGEGMAEPTAMPDELLGGSEELVRLVSVLRHAIEKDLTPRQRAAILAELREVPFDQVAQLLGVNRNAAYKLLHDARRALKARLQEAGITGKDIQIAFDV